MNRRDMIKAVGAVPLTGLCGISSTAHAQGPSYPAKPITLVVPFAAGNSADILARLVAQRMGESLGQPVVVENRPGAGGVGAINQVASAAPDGHTLLLIGTGAAISQSLFKPAPYDLLKRFAPVSNLTETEVLVLVNKSSRFHSLADFIQEARLKKDSMTVGVSLLGTTQHLTAELFQLNAKVDYTIVPLKTAAAAYTALNAGDIDVAFELMPPVLSLINGGQLRALATAGAKRSELVPTVPTMNELGIPNVGVTSWGMILAPALTPDAIVQRLNRDVQRALNEPEIAKRFKDLGMSTLGGTATQARGLLADEITRWGGVIDKTKISLK